MEKVRKWLENYWYYYKWHTVIGAFLIVFFAICIGQIVQREKIDAFLLYAGPVSLGENETTRMRAAFEQVMEEDFNRDGKKTAQIQTVFYMNALQIAEAEKAAKEAGVTDYYVDTQYMADARNRLDLHFLAGDAYVCLLDPEIYSGMKRQGAFAEILPEGAEDRTGIRFSETDFGAFFEESFSFLPEDTVLCLRKVPATSLGKSGEAEKQAFQASLLKKILAFSLPE